MLLHLKQNGFGLRYGAAFECPLPTGNLWFDTAPQMFNEIAADQPLVLGGEPGAGKSHIADDILKTSYASGLGCFMLSCLINCNNLKGRAETEATFATAQDLGQDCMIVLDNLDFTIYTGGLRRRRSNRVAAEYCDYISSATLRSLDAGCRILATVHSDEWRDNHSDALPKTKTAYGALVQALGGEKQFTGAMSYDNAVRIIGNRGIDPSTTIAIADALRDNDGLNFRNARHIDPGTFASQGASAALHSVRETMLRKIAGGA
jgi:hypothetical protein